MLNNRGSSILALSLAIGLVASPTLGVTLEGRLTGELLGDRVAGAIVHAAIDDATVRSSAPLGDDGTFAIDGLREGTWNLAVQTKSGLHVAAVPVPVRAGETKTVRISLAPAAHADDEPVIATPPKSSSRGFWNNPVTATLIVIGAAVIVGVAVDEATKDEDVSVSPSSD